MTARQPSNCAILVLCTASLGSSDCAPGCRTGKVVASWPVHTNNQSARSFHMRLPADQASAALKLLLGHSEFGLLASGSPV